MCEVPLVLLHGIGSNGASWEEQRAWFAPTRQVLAWDAPGYGGTPWLTAERPTVDDYAQALADFLGEVGPVDLVGHSLGALIAARFCLRAPSAVRRLVLSSPAAGYAVPAGGALPPALAQRISDVTSLGPAGMAERRAARTLSAGATPQALARVRAAMAAVTVEGYSRATWMLAQADIFADAARLSQPTLVLCGTEDVVTPIAGVRRIAGQIAGARFEAIAGAGHASYADRPELFCAAVAAFLDDRPAG